MNTRTTLQAWIVEGIAATGGPATPLGVSRQIWARHRSDLESAGDLLYTWQIEMRTVAEAMIAAGLLTTDGHVWMVGEPGAIAAVAKPTAWSDEELTVAVDAYVSLLRDRDEGRPLRRQEAATRVRDSTGRSSAAVDALFANISAVVQEMGIEFLAAYAPRSNVPRGVRQIVRSTLEA